MRYKMRNIVIDGQEFVWRTGTGDPFDHTRNRFTECFVAYLKNKKTAPLQIYFRMGLANAEGEYNRNEDGIIQFDILGDAYLPSGAAKLIRHGLQQGWDPESDKRPFVIKNGKKGCRGASIGVMCQQIDLIAKTGNKLNHVDKQSIVCFSVLLVSACEFPSQALMNLVEK